VCSSDLSEKQDIMMANNIKSLELFTDFFIHVELTNFNWW
jgi:hypothetical protein